MLDVGYDIGYDIGVDCRVIFLVPQTFILILLKLLQIKKKKPKIPANWKPLSLSKNSHCLKQQR